MKFKLQPLTMIAVSILFLMSFAFAQTDSLAPETPVDTAAVHHTQISGENGHGESHAAEGGEHGGLGTSLPLWSVIPFIGILLSIAIFPLVAPHFWHHHYGKVSAFWGLLMAVPFLYAYGGEGLYEILHTYLLEYIPFIILLWALYTIAGGIYIQGAPVGTPTNNLVLLIIGTALASWIGTTGAAMVLIRPFIKMNQYRQSKVHMIIFFIFLVANVGGSLTPLGDPPLFLGFLQGVHFFWTFNLFTEMLSVAGTLLLIFFVWDTYMYRKEGWHKKMHSRDFHLDLPDDLADELILEEDVEMEDAVTHKKTTKKYFMDIKGLFNVFFLLGVIGGVLFSGYVHLGEVDFLGVHMTLQNIARDLFLILMGLLSLKLTPKAFREGNEFNWFPIVEVAKLFAGIFITIIPALAMLRVGEAGHLNFIIKVAEEPWHYFWITGTLSSFLDNAPTYLVFFNTALGKFSHLFAVNEGVKWLMYDAHGIEYLRAVSTGAVFFGAMTYIGNAPNFMVKSICEQSNIKMPSFFGYMAYSVVMLGLIFVAVTLVFF